MMQAMPDIEKLISLGVMQLIESKIDIKELIVPEKQKKQILTILNQIKSRAEMQQQWSRPFDHGLSALFYGTSGTGKTMAAEVLSHALNMPLYRIDLSHVVNKYIGETEKNLNYIFNASEGSDCILFFDEADALFGKRSDVKDAHDRYANTEISYLLQRLETFKGIVILTTNRRQNIDTAFTRRLHSVIEFPFPDKKERQQIWEQVFHELDSSELDMAYLAKQFKLTGGHIRNIALNTCLRSKFDGQTDTPGKVTMENTLRAVKRELNRPV
jgi:SpoVK/Ycf46/Vps4 family AAA+-type ATPase